MDTTLLIVYNITQPENALKGNCLVRKYTKRTATPGGEFLHQTKLIFLLSIDVWSDIMIFQVVILVNVHLQDQPQIFVTVKMDNVPATPIIKDVNVTNVHLDFSIILLVILMVMISKQIE